MDDINKKLWLLLCVLLCFIAAGGLASERCGRQAGGALCPDGLCNAAAVLPLPPAASPTSSPGTPSTRCSCTATNLPAPPEASTPTMSSLKRPSRSRPSAAPAMLKRAGGRSRLSWARLPTRPAAVGPAPVGPYAWGYCFNKEGQPSSSFCDMSSRQFPCVPGRQYYGRGPFLISWNFNYGPCGKAIGVDLLNNPDLVSTDAVISFKTALWFWMRGDGWTNIPSCHDVMTGIWTPFLATEPSPTSSTEGWSVGEGRRTRGLRIALDSTRDTATYSQ